MKKTNAKPEPPRYLRISLYLDDAEEVRLITEAADMARRSRNNWIIQMAVKAAKAQLRRAQRQEAATT